MPLWLIFIVICEPLTHDGSPEHPLEPDKSGNYIQEPDESGNYTQEPDESGNYTGFLLPYKVCYHDIL